MKLICISDVHNKFDDIQVPPGDILVCSGDLTMGGRVDEITKAAEWLGRQPHKYKITCLGNHDFLGERQPALTKEIFSSNGVTLLDHEAVVVEGLKFFGSPYTPYFHNWAFNLRRGEEIRQKWLQIPVDTDVLITHGPPQHIGDEVFRNAGVWDGDDEERIDFSYGIEHVGCWDLADVISKNLELKAHVFGHIHKSYGVYKNQPVSLNTIFVNASCCTEEYKATNSPIVIDL